MTEVSVRHLDADRFAITVRGHQLVVDQPAEDGGADTGPTPTELFIAGLTSCVAFYARRYLARHDLPTDGLAVSADYDLARSPGRVSAVRIGIALPPGVPEARREPLLAVASHCTVHNSLTTPPDVSIALEEL